MPKGGHHHHRRWPSNNNHNNHNNNHSQRSSAAAASGQHHHYAPPRPPFDIYMVDDFFPRVAPIADHDTQLSTAILARNTELTPTPEEQTNIINMVSKVQMVLENITLSPGTFDACQIDEVRPVGSFKKGTMKIGHNCADLVVILKTLPVIDAIQSLGAKVLEELAKLETNSSSSSSSTTTTTAAPDIGIDDHPSGFAIVNRTTRASVRILIATIMPNLRKLDPKIHLPVKLIQRHLSAIRHARWFEESANVTTVKVLIRVLRDLFGRFQGLSALTPWMIDVLAHYSVTFRHQQSLLPLNTAFKRVLQLLAGGIFLPGSTGISDPCENGAITLHSSLSLIQEDTICMTAQTLLRILSYGDGYRIILGLDPDNTGITDNMSVWDGVVVAPSTAAFELPPKDDEMDTQETAAAVGGGGTGGSSVDKAIIGDPIVVTVSA
ncbi:interleukin enhancer-binding factor 2 homolog [Oppia nitens]|uniref:interleukin enhancer-binding factor 2 homolog n=1 Tax=Oppia nitens TaxID=1686743 RepID=UPI0023DCADA3|nr:interleukin enhancer-binding factor 2 homolog [Oppia nitens]